VNDELYHYGIIGQKWGLRRFQFSDGSYTAIGKQRRRIGSAANERAKYSEISAARNRRALSDEELDARIKRLEKEKRLKELTENDVAPGKKFVKEVVSSSGKKVATTLVSGATLYAVKAALNKKQDKDWSPDYSDIADAITGLKSSKKSDKNSDKKSKDK
jgi:hypothetical protein